MDVKLQNVPEILQKFGLFCLWKYEERGGRKTKVPYNPQTMERGDSTDKSAFVSFPEIVNIWQRVKDQFDGIGVGVFDQIAAVDIDHCIAAETGLSELARDIIARLNSYAEISPGNNGIRIFFGVLNTDWYDKSKYYVNNRNRGLEIYLPGTTNRFLTFTGNTTNRRPVMMCESEIRAILDDYMLRQPKEENQPQLKAAPADRSDSELIDEAAAASYLFRKLWSGDISGYPSHSEADLALCNFLARLTGRNEGRMDALFRQSGLMRDKWNRKDYRTATIQKAIRDCKTVYDPDYGRNDPARDFSAETLEPKDKTDLGQVAIFVREYGDIVRYSDATKYLVYDGKLWNENDLDAQRLVQKLAERQTKEARKQWSEANAAEMAASEAAAGVVRDALEGDNEELKAAKAAVKKAKAYHSWAMKQQDSNRISRVLKELKPQVQINIEELDADGFLLNTPAGTVDLRTGQIRPHNANDHCTKITGTAPGKENAELYKKFLDQVTSGDQDLERYLQEVAGMCAVGKVFSEKLIIAYGEGGNGKSTLFNLWADVLGDYAGTIPSESLVVRGSNAKDYSIANLRGKRLIIAAELREGARLSTDAVKKMCSTDKVTAEKKFKDSFEFKPSHTIVLYTNILPRVGTNDSGTWSRLVVVPFKAKFRDQAGEIKNYAEYLFRMCGGAVLDWIIEGAKRFIENGGVIRLPECVRNEIEQYKDQNDWFKDFIEECCTIGKGFNVGAATLYRRYKDYCDSTKEYQRSKAEFSTELINAGYKRIRDMHGVKYYGLTIKYREFNDNFSA